MERRRLLRGAGSENEPPNKTRRLSSRVRDTTVSYSLSSPRRSSAKPSQEQKAPLIYKNSRRDLLKIETPSGSVSKQARDAICKDNLANIQLYNEELIDELFHLTHYTSLIYFNPQEPDINKETELYQEFAKDYPLWPASDDESSGRKRSSRRVREDAVSPLKAEINGLVQKKRSLLEKQKPQTKPSTPQKKSSPQKLVKGKTPIKPVPKESESEQEESDESEESQNSSEEDEEEDTRPASRKIITKFTLPRQSISHPSHVTEPNFSTLRQFLESYKSLDDDLSPEEYEAHVKSQIELLGRIRRGIENRVLRIDFDENVNRIHPNATREPTMIKLNTNYIRYKDPFIASGQITHHDHLVAHGLVSAKLIHESRNSKITKSKKIALMIENHFKRKSQEKDREAKEYKIKIQRLAKETARLVKRKWMQAEKAYKILEEREREKERAIKSKQHLSEILQHSTQLLEAQLTRNASESATPVPTDTDAHGSESDVESAENSDDESGASDFDSGSGSSSEDETEVKDQDLDIGNDQVVDDSKLSVEELRAKYKDLQNFAAKSESESDAENESESDKDTDLATLYGADGGSGIQNTSIVDGMTQEERENLLNNEERNSVLDSEEESESDDSLLDSDDESSEEEAEETPRASGLAALFGKIEDEPEERDESVRSSDSEDDASAKEEDTPNSTPGGQDVAPEKDSSIDASAVPDVPVPQLLKGTLRVYQKQGLNWLASLYNSNTNGILADEMGLGKTIQTISLIAYLACEKNIWGPHLIVVPTSVMLNWEMEFKRFAPGFKVMTYYGSPQVRKEKRKGWNKLDTFHVCITSYQLVVQDQQVFKRKKWKYMILDEAHNIKNFRSQRWKALLNFNTENRLLLTGTPLQNNIMELWSLLYFLMPSTRAGSRQTMPDGFANLMDFQQWFGRPVDKIIQAAGGVDGADEETKATVSKLHQVLRPYLLRRLKADVEKQMPAKYEHIVYCRLSKRQRFLYDDFMSRAQTRETLASGNFLSIINCLMQLRKVCNHPDLFEVRPILTSFAMEKSAISEYDMKELVVRRNLRGSTEKVDLSVINLVPSENTNITTFENDSIQTLTANGYLKSQCDLIKNALGEPCKPDFSTLEGYFKYHRYVEQEQALSSTEQFLYLNKLRSQKPLIYSKNLIAQTTIKQTFNVGISDVYNSIVKPLDTRVSLMKDTVDKYAFVTPAVVALDMNDKVVPADVSGKIVESNPSMLEQNPFHEAQVKLSIAFPDKGLLQYDCGKLQKLAMLLQELSDNGHRALIFTQMTKVLDILELFLNYHGYRYMRLDGATKIEDRQLLTERFNTDSRITCFILSTRSGGLGINLTGADTVIFYDSDWNPAMDKQCQDRCHRIGQTRDVHIYRFVSEYTIESNILRKANQKRQLDNVVIQDGDFTTDYFGKLSVKDLLGEEGGGDDDAPLLLNANPNSKNLTSVLAEAEDADDAAAANVAIQEVALDDADFDDSNMKTSSTAEVTPSGTAGGTASPASERRSESVVGDGPRVASEEVEAEFLDHYNQVEEDEEEDDGIGHIDEYMIRFIAGGFYWD
ncbi:unnamed protein product [Kuraishia capsulata CBS 1993]|uniref:Helicase SWR1 n=1 Tax=Kuraishia capsulata CBS 1993 TaxID=1382522 RepID=W6MGM3_9ASCO|nr:uncharacterized protein KUCA_T00000948001 [Kuraishia capsulata CBS 1993]CDK24981.1 unnamed protein product [Kuraishia capsulata CBS 1993]